MLQPFAVGFRELFLFFWAESAGEKTRRAKAKFVACLRQRLTWCYYELFIFIEDTLVLDVRGASNVALAGMADAFRQGHGCAGGRFQRSGGSLAIWSRRGKAPLGFRKHALA